MTDQMNGAAPGQDPPPTQQNVQAFLEDFIAPILTGAVNGIIYSLRQFQVEFLIPAICGLFGRTIGATLSIGDLVPVMNLRKKCLEAFQEGMRGVKIKPIPAGMQPDPTQTADLLKKIKAGAN